MTLVFSGLKKIFVDLNANKTIGTMNGPMGKIKSQITRKTLRFLKLFLSITGTEYVPTTHLSEAKMYHKLALVIDIQAT